MKSELHSFVEKVELVSVLLKSQNGHCLQHPSNINPAEIDLGFDFSARFEYVKDQSLLFAFILVSVKGAKKNTKELQFDLSSEYTLTYSHKQFEGQVSEILLKDFTSTTALFNAFPYLRETIQGMSCKMGIPPVLLPLLKISSDKKNEVSSEKEDSPAKSKTIKKTVKHPTKKQK